MCGLLYFLLFFVLMGPFSIFALLPALVSLVFGYTHWAVRLAAILSALLALFAAIGIVKYVFTRKDDDEAMLRKAEERLQEEWKQGRSWH